MSIFISTYRESSVIAWRIHHSNNTFLLQSVHLEIMCVCYCDTSCSAFSDSFRSKEVVNPPQSNYSYCIIALIWLVILQHVALPIATIHWAPSCFPIRSRLSRMNNTSVMMCVVTEWNLSNLRGRGLCRQLNFATSLMEGVQLMSEQNIAHMAMFLWLPWIDDSFILNAGFFQFKDIDVIGLTLNTFSLFDINLSYSSTYNNHMTRIKSKTVYLFMIQLFVKSRTCQT